MQILITGREQELSLAEIEVTLGDLRVLNSQAVVVTQTEAVNIDRLGGTIKAANLIGELEKVDLSQVAEVCLKYITNDSPSSKFNYGFSHYGKGRLNLRKLGIGLKRQLQQAGLKPRLIESKNDNINAASVKHNKLIAGYEFLLVEYDKKLIIARTSAVQDIDAYSKRDYQKPCRNSKVGMLPPKLSQILINLASPSANTLVVDPFCGSGGLVMEASLMGYKADASDLDPAMTDCTRTNLEWFNSEFLPAGVVNIGSPIDATKRDYHFDNYVIASEGFLGQNFSVKPKLGDIESQLNELKDLYIRFFSHLRAQPTQPTRISICLPFWMVGNDKIELNIIDDIAKLGYTKSEFTSVRSSVLEYYRQGQYTGRQILNFQ